MNKSQTVYHNWIAGILMQFVCVKYNEILLLCIELPPFISKTTKNGHNFSAIEYYPKAVYF